jgi:hypothetical protein
MPTIEIEKVHEWIDVSPYEERCQQFAEAMRSDSNRGPNPRPWSPRAELDGKLFECAFGEFTGRLEEINWVVGRGDGGTDFMWYGKILNVRGRRITPRVPCPALLVAPPQGRHAELYLLGHLLEMRAQIVGWASWKQIEQCPWDDFRHGPCRRADAWRMLRANQMGLPPRTEPAPAESCAHQEPAPA